LVHYQKYAIKATDNVYARKDTLVPDVTNVYLVIMDIPIVNHVVVQNEEVHLPFVMPQENVPAYLVLPEEHVNNVVQDIINILSANFVIAIVKDRLEFRAITKENVCVNQILWELDVINAKKGYTIFLFVKNVIVILLVFFQRSPVVDHYHWASCANVNRECTVEYVMSVENYFGTYNPRIPTVVKTAIVLCLAYLAVLAFATRSQANVFANHQLLLEDVTNVPKVFTV